MLNVAYFDTSALLKRYVTETGTQWVKNLLSADDAPLVFTSHLTVVEATCAFARRACEGDLSPQALDNLLRLFALHIVCALKRDYWAVITVCLPSAEQWEPDWRTRSR